VLTDVGRVVYFEPLTDLPAECLATLDASSQAVVDAVVAAVEEHFHPGVDPGWAGRVAALTPPAAGDEAALLAAITELLAPLGDPEIALQAGTEPIWAPSPGGVAPHSPPHSSTERCSGGGHRRGNGTSPSTSVAGCSISACSASVVLPTAAMARSV
jgi:hypothetical protein